MSLQSITRRWRYALTVMACAAVLATLSACQPGDEDSDEQTEALEQSEQAARDVAQPAPEAAAVPPPVGNCDAAQVQGLVGTAFDEAAGTQAMQDANAQQLRVLKPEDMATMDFVGERLNIELDDKGVVSSVRCG